ncbi:MAG: TauD/TfdA family dioxygenase [Candidatus Rhabdochlamydia sp.]
MDKIVAIIFLSLAIIKNIDLLCYESVASPEFSELSNIFSINNETTEIQMNQLSETLGVEVIGLDLSLGIKTEEVNALKTLLAKYLVVVIRNQHLSVQQQTDITRCFGDLEAAWNNENRHRKDDYVYVITNNILKQNPNYKSPTYFWHWDKNFIRYPTSISFAFFDSEPQPEGLGMTGFSNLYAAYNGLSEKLKQEIESLYVIHSYDHMTNIRQKNYEKASLKFQRGAEKFPDVIHPLVRIHPITGKRTLNLDELYQSKIIGIPEEKNNELKESLLEQAVQKKYLYFHSWKKGDFVFWDNLALLHKGTPSDPKIERILYRTNTSSRKDFEGRCILIGMEQGAPDPATLSKQLFSNPLIIDSDSYEELSLLENHIKLLKMGYEIRTDEMFIPPHAIVILKGKKWKQSKLICSLIHLGVLSKDCKENRMIFSKVRTIIHDTHSQLIHTLQNFCLNFFLIQDSHERLINGDLSFDYLDKKQRILVQSKETYYDSSCQTFSSVREHLHAKILYEIFKKTHLELNEDEWFEKLKAKRENETLSLKIKPWCIFLEGEQSSCDTLANQLQMTGIINDNSIIISLDLFFSYLFNDIPYAHKVKFWPSIDKEMNYLMLLMTKIAIQNNINVVIKTPILSNTTCSRLVEIVNNHGGKSMMIALHTPLNINYENSKKNSNTIEELYEQLVFRKVISASWKKFVENFDITFLIENDAELNDDKQLGELIFQSERAKEDFCIFSFDHLQQFLAQSLIDPDKVVTDIEFSNQEQQIDWMNHQQLMQNSPEQVLQLIPEKSQFVNSPKLFVTFADIAKLLR